VHQVCFPLHKKFYLCFYLSKQEDVLQKKLVNLKSWHNSLIVVTGCGLQNWAVNASKRSAFFLSLLCPDSVFNLWQKPVFILSPKCPDQLWVPLVLLFSGSCGLFLGVLQLKQEAYLLPVSNAEVKNDWS
jgi:hypothetical protein